MPQNNLQHKTLLRDPATPKNPCITQQNIKPNRLEINSTINPLLEEHLDWISSGQMTLALISKTHT